MDLIIIGSILFASQSSDSANSPTLAGLLTYYSQFPHYLETVSHLINKVKTLTEVHMPGDQVILVKFDFYYNNEFVPKLTPFTGLHAEPQDRNIGTVAASLPPRSPNMSIAGKRGKKLRFGPSTISGSPLARLN